MRRIISNRNKNRFRLTIALLLSIIIFSASDGSLIQVDILGIVSGVHVAHPGSDMSTTGNDTWAYVRGNITVNCLVPWIISDTYALNDINNVNVSDTQIDVNNDYFFNFTIRILLYINLLIPSKKNEQSYPDLGCGNCPFCLLPRLD